VQTLRIVQAPWNSRYIALSYVWGSVPTFSLLKQNVGQVLGTDGLHSVYDRLPQTIHDAILAVIVLQEAYLWVDALCLVQDDKAEIDEAVTKMGLIYENSVLTIIAATGKDSSSGLPGLRNGSRLAAQTVEEVFPGTRMMVLRTVDQYLEPSVYRSRGWT
jgi:hypothetical protein